MKTVILSSTYPRIRIDEFLKLHLSNMSKGDIYKCLRNKDVKVNGLRVKFDFVVCEGDEVQIYLNHKMMESEGNTQTFDFEVIFEDENLLVANKKQGISVHPDKIGESNTLIQQVIKYLENKNEQTGSVGLCHRIDRNTGGLIMIAKNKDFLNFILDKMRENAIKKFYVCIVKGEILKKSDTLIAFMKKDSKKNRVIISKTYNKNSFEMITNYKVVDYYLDYNNDVYSEIEVILITGRTHQIRAHTSFIGHPIIGDGKYGLNSINRKLGIHKQFLFANKLIFDFNSKNKYSKYNHMNFELNLENEYRAIKNKLRRR